VVCNSAAMNLHLAEIAAMVAPGRHASCFPTSRMAPLRTAQGAAEHHPVPAAAEVPELNMMENVWQFMRDNWLSNRVFQTYDDIVDHCATPGTGSSISPGASCRSASATGRMGSDQRNLVY
jgi:hypothetical protein